MPELLLSLFFSFSSIFYLSYFITALGLLLYLGCRPAGDILEPAAILWTLYVHKVRRTIQRKCIKGTEWMTKGFQICIQGTEQEYFPLDLWPVIQKRSNYRLRKCFVMSDQGDVNCQKSLNWNNLLYPATLTRLPPGPALLLAKTTPSLPLITTPWNWSLLVLSAWTSLRWKSKSAMLTTFCLKKSSPTFARRASGLAFHTQGKIGISNKDKNYYSYSLILYCCCFPPRDYVLFGNMVVMLLLPFLLISVLIIAFYETDKFL